ncbi:MAG: hypothetical protein NC417_10955 [Candidatus Gastranaerophilales bacterium]|nr:hypothetical protein [Candidatus Gastranaerophilales bacterium]
MAKDNASKNVTEDEAQMKEALAEESESLEQDLEDDLEDVRGGPDQDEEQEKVSLWNALTYGVVIVLVVLLCTLVWAATHRNRGGDIPSDVEGMAETDTESLSTQNGLPESAPQETASQENEPSGTTTSQSEDVAPSSAQESQMPQESSSSAEVMEPVSGDSSMTFQEVNEAVTAKDVTNLRSEPNTGDSENVLAQLMNGDSLTRTGINEDTGWSRLLWQEQEVYAVTQYLTTDLSYRPPVAQGDPNRVATIDGRVIIFVDCDDTITPKEYVNLRVEPSTSQGDATVRVQLNYGEQAHRTGYSPDAGWSRVEYNGEVLYVVSSYVLAVQ